MSTGSEIGVLLQSASPSQEDAEVHPTFGSPFRLLGLITASVCGLACGAFVGVIVGVFTGLIPFNC